MTTRGLAGEVGGARSSLRHEGAVQAGKKKGKEIKGSERVIRKAAGDECVFIPDGGLGWQVRSGPTPYHTRRA